MDSAGVEYRITRANKVPRIDDRILYSVGYLYHSEEEAKAGVADGGTCFLVNVASQEHPESHDVYAVTCAHVIEAGATVARLETVPAEKTMEIPEKGSGCRTIPLGRNQWRCSPTDDLAIAYLGRKNALTNEHYSIPSFLLLTEPVVYLHDINVGDDVYMVGRFLYHDGKRQHRPSVRSGLISLMAHDDDPVVMNDHEVQEYSAEPEYQEAFLVEMRSQSGWSGSPVIWQLPLIDVIWGRKLGAKAPGFRRPREGSETVLIGPWLVGVETATWPDKGVSVVVPAWKILEMLNTEEFEMERKEEDKKTAKKEADNPLKLTYEKRREPLGVTRDEFLASLQKASRKVSQPESGTKETSE